MDNDFDQMRDILEMAEFLTAEAENRLEVQTYNDTTGKSANIVFEFNEDQELVNVYTED